MCLVPAAHASTTHAADAQVGYFSKDGKFNIKEAAMPTYIVPDLTNTLLRPYVADYSECHTAPAMPVQHATFMQSAHAVHSLGGR